MSNPSFRLAGRVARAELFVHILSLSILLVNGVHFTPLFLPLHKAVIFLPLSLSQLNLFQDHNHYKTRGIMMPWLLALLTQKYASKYVESKMTFQTRKVNVPVT